MEDAALIGLSRIAADALAMSIRIRKPPPIGRMTMLILLVGAFALGLLVVGVSWARGQR